MKTRQILTFVPFVAILVVLIGLVAVDPVSPGTNPTASPPSGNSDGQADGLELLVAGDAGVAKTAEPADSGLEPSQDGSKLLQIYCSECHAVGLLERTEKPREAWEKILARMEKSGVQLNDNERSALLDHLTGRDEP